MDKKLSAFRSFNIVKIVTPCSISFGFLAGPKWDSDSEIENYQNPRKFNEQTYPMVQTVTDNTIKPYLITYLPSYQLILDKIFCMH